MYLAQLNGDTLISEMRQLRHTRGPVEMQIERITGVKE